jgi:hypothetical protein
MRITATRKAVTKKISTYPTLTLNLLKWNMLETDLLIKKQTIPACRATLMTV